MITVCQQVTPGEKRCLLVYILYLILQERIKGTSNNYQFVTPAQAGVQ